MPSPSKPLYRKSLLSAPLAGSSITARDRQYGEEELLVSSSSNYTSEGKHSDRCRHHEDDSPELMPVSTPSPSTSNPSPKSKGSQPLKKRLIRPSLLAQFQPQNLEPSLAEAATKNSSPSKTHATHRNPASSSPATFLKKSPEKPVHQQPLRGKTLDTSSKSINGVPTTKEKTGHFPLAPPLPETNQKPPSPVLCASLNLSNKNDDDDDSSSQSVHQSVQGKTVEQPSKSDDVRDGVTLKETNGVSQQPPLLNPPAAAMTALQSDHSVQINASNQSAQQSLSGNNLDPNKFVQDGVTLKETNGAVSQQPQLPNTPAAALQSHHSVQINASHQLGLQPSYGTTLDPIKSVQDGGSQRPLLPDLSTSTTETTPPRQDAPPVSSLQHRHHPSPSGIGALTTSDSPNRVNLIEFPDAMDVIFGQSKAAFRNHPGNLAYNNEIEKAASLGLNRNGSSSSASSSSRDTKSRTTVRTSSCVEFLAWFVHIHT
jgi:hypothetical protein